MRRSEKNCYRVACKWRKVIKDITEFKVANKIFLAYKNNNQTVAYIHTDTAVDLRMQSTTEIYCSLTKTNATLQLTVQLRDVTHSADVRMLKEIVMRAGDDVIVQ